MPTPTLLLLRHGESTANAAGLFTGVFDAELTARGRAEAANAAGLIRTAGLVPDATFTSPLSRAADTARIVLDALGRQDEEVTTDWRLTERSYGALTGRAKEEVLAEFGEELFLEWRRSLGTRPPAMSDAQYERLRAAPPFDALPDAAMPRTESLRDVMVRVEPVLTDVVGPALAAGRSVLVVAHGNSLRAVVGLLDGSDEDELRALNIPTGQPLVYDVEASGRPVPRSGRYLDPETAHQAARVIAAEGGT